MAPPLTPLTCYTDPSGLNIALGLFLMIGTLVSYVPQYWTIIRLQSSDGLSWVTLAFALESAYLTAINSLILKWVNATCCKDLSPGQCLKNNLATEQLLIGLISYLILYGLYLMYFKTNAFVFRKFTVKQIAWFSFFFVNISSIFLGIIALVFYYQLGFSATIVQRYAQVLGLISSILIILMYLPQIWTTWKLQDAGSLSLLMLLIQLPGALLVIVFQGFFQEADVTTWVPYIFLALSQLILIVMLCGFMVRDWVTGKKKRVGDVGENQRLLDITPPNTSPRHSADDFL